MSDFFDILLKACLSFFLIVGSILCLIGFGTLIVEKIQDIKKNFPTIIKEEIVTPVHGFWIEYGEPNSFGEYEKWYDRCSVCGKIGFDKYYYCPSCGARMDEEEE